MGSNLGNLTHDEAIALLARVRQRMQGGDALLLGLDLQKNPERILRAYDDAQGVTARFNLNLLVRLNRELGMDFAPGRFRHYACYSPLDGAARSFLVSQGVQRVHSSVLGAGFDFDDGESIYMEQSQKYTPALVDVLVQSAGMQVDACFVDTADRYGVFLCVATGAGGG